MLLVALAMVAAACGGDDTSVAEVTPTPTTQATTTTTTTTTQATTTTTLSGNLSDCVGFYVGLFDGDDVGPLALDIADDGSLSGVFVRPGVLGIDLSDLTSGFGILETIGLVPGEDFEVGLAGLEIAPGALDVVLGGVRVGNIELEFAPVGSVGKAGVVQPGAGNGADLTGEFEWATCTGSGDWTDGNASGRWQVAMPAVGLGLELGSCDGGIYVGGAVDVGGLEIDLDALCLSLFASDAPKEPLKRGIEVGRKQGVEVYTVEELVLFEFGSATLTPEADETLAAVALAIAEGGVASPTIEVIGHTDSIGSSESNLELSLQRAVAVVVNLADRLPDSTLSAAGLGETNPIAPNTNDDGTDNPDGRRQNRRVEIIVTG